MILIVKAKDLKEEDILCEDENTRDFSHGMNRQT